MQEKNDVYENEEWLQRCHTHVVIGMLIILNLVLADNLCWNRVLVHLLDFCRFKTQEFKRDLMQFKSLVRRPSKKGMRKKKMEWDQWAWDSRLGLVWLHCHLFLETFFGNKSKKCATNKHHRSSPICQVRLQSIRGQVFAISQALGYRSYVWCYGLVKTVGNLVK